MAKRISALQGHFDVGRFGNSESLGIKFELLESLQLGQIAAWPTTLEHMGVLSAQLVDITLSSNHSPPKPMHSIGDANNALLRIEPLKWWLLGTELPEIAAEIGSCIDLSHSRTRIRVTGSNARELLNRHLPLDLSLSNFPSGCVASSAVHHVGVTLWHNELGYDLFIPRSFAVSVWEVLLKSALQFGVQVLQIQADV